MACSALALSSDEAERMADCPGSALLVGPRARASHVTAKAICQLGMPLPAAGCGRLFAGLVGLRSSAPCDMTRRAEAMHRCPCSGSMRLNKGFGGRHPAMGEPAAVRPALLTWMDEKNHCGVRGGHGPTCAQTYAAGVMRKGSFEVSFSRIARLRPSGRTILYVCELRHAVAHFDPEEVLVDRETYSFGAENIELDPCGRPCNSRGAFSGCPHVIFRSGPDPACQRSCRYEARRRTAREQECIPESVGQAAAPRRPASGLRG